MCSMEKPSPTLATARVLGSKRENRCASRAETRSAPAARRYLPGVREVRAFARLRSSMVMALLGLAVVGCVSANQPRTHDRSKTYLTKDCTGNEYLTGPVYFSCSAP